METLEELKEKFDKLNKERSILFKKICKLENQEILKKFPYAFKYGVYGNSCECTICAYFNICYKILPGFTRPIKCDGPFYKHI